MTGFNSAIRSRPRTRLDVAAIPLDGGPDLRVHILKYDLGDYVDIRYFSDGRATLHGLTFPLELAGRLSQAPDGLSTSGPDPENGEIRPWGARSGLFFENETRDKGDVPAAAQRRKKRNEAFEILMRAVHGKDGGENQGEVMSQPRNAQELLKD